MASRSEPCLVVTGGTGLIGSALLEAILTAFPEQTVRAVYCSSRPGIYDQRVEWVRADLSRIGDCCRALSGLSLIHI
ncbi:MAG: NAD-dependent epimerase/dehydratase family protein, partial [Negativicutes bacterium]|nr:NAD-dependent epimerase/dehydratase family protein [Negativicutes bacterium]